MYPKTFPTYKWVKRDSYLPMNNQGLKDAARIKLGYFPDDIDPEDMLRFAVEEPQKLASYSVSDAVATYYLYIKYVHSHIFSIASLIPLPTVQILCKGSATLCEALLFAESINFQLLVPSKKRSDNLEYTCHILENLTYIGGHVESFKAGIFRADFDHNFNISQEIITLFIENLDNFLEEYIDNPEYSVCKKDVIDKLERLVGDIAGKSNIWHLDVGAMYPNIILTNRLQPIAVVNEDVCIHCDFNNESNNCKRKVECHSRAEYIPPSSNEINMIKNQLQNETFYKWDELGKKPDDETNLNKATDLDSDGLFVDEDKANNKAYNQGGQPFNSNLVKYGENNQGKKVSYSRLPLSKQEALLKERVIDYSKKIYKKVKKTEIKLQELTICQREVPFYVETVRKFRDQRNIIKGFYKKSVKEYENNPTEEHKKKIVLYNGMQVAYKCVLNSFYGYVMRTGSRWFSLEMAAAVCHIGGKIIKLAKDFVKQIGIPLELDTDGIWCLLPADFPSTMKLGNNRISLLGKILNYFVCKKFTNEQYQVLNSDGYKIMKQNSIEFEADGPYKAMIIPSSTEENRLLKKRYVVFDFNDTIVELKVFELKRRGELNLVKKFQEDLFTHFNDGKNLQECYDSLGECCNYWYDIIDTKGRFLDDENIFDLFSESRNMSKSVEGYRERKTNILSTAKKLSEFLGQDILEDKCEFIICKYPENAPVSARCIPVLIFRHPEKNKFLKQWFKNRITELRDIIDWQYYCKRFENILQRMVVIPAYFQNISNPIKRIELPQWIKDKKQVRLQFERHGDIEDIGIKRNLTDIFYGKINKKVSIVEGMENKNVQPEEKLILMNEDEFDEQMQHAVIICGTASN